MTDALYKPVVSATLASGIYPANALYCAFIAFDFQYKWAQRLNFMTGV